MFRKIILNKDSLKIILVFILFYVFKTQFQNLVIFTLDHLFFEGIISDIYTYNYASKLSGCLEVAKAQGLLGNMANLFYSLTVAIFFSFSLLAYVLLITRIKKILKFDLLCWMLLAVFSFNLFDALQFVIFNLPDMLDYIFRNQKLLLLFTQYSITVVLAILLFIKYMNLKVKLKVLILGIPSVYMGLIIWAYIGRLIMPVNHL